MDPTSLSLYCAPLEGVTGYVFRQLHRERFPGVDKYFAPFITPRSRKSFKTRDRNDLHPDHNTGTVLVPQILTDDAEGFLTAAQAMADLGYREVNLNLGCPSGTVTAKGRGSAFLARQPELERFLEAVCAKSPLPVSVKTRVGMDYEEEWEELLPIFNRYPLSELIIHPRLRRDFYQGAVRMHLFRDAVRQSVNPVVYNGDLRTPSDITALTNEFPELSAVMIGRGLVTDLSLSRQLRGGAAMTAEELKHFHDDLMNGYRSYLSGDRALLFKMKEMWSFWLSLFPNAERGAKHLRKSKNLSDYSAAVQEIFASGMVSVSSSSAAYAENVPKTERIEPPSF